MGMLKRRLMFLLLCLLLLWQPAQAAESLAAETESPAARIAVVKVAADHTVEVGIEVSGQSLRGVGAVLEYNSARLRLISWGSSGTPVALNDGTGYANAEIVPAKGPDGLMGKPALAWKEAAAGAGTTTGGAAEATGAAVTWNGVYLGADTLKETALSDQRAVTVRFAYVTESGSPEQETAAETALTEETLNGYVRWASSSEAANTPVGAPFSLISQSGREEPVYYELEAAVSPAPPAGEGSPTDTAGIRVISVPFVLTQGSSADSGGGSFGGGGPVVVFFDWDGGVMDAIALPETASERPAAVEAFQNRADMAAALSGKKGYAFDQWLLVTRQGEELATKNGTFSSNDAALELTDPLVKEDVADFTAADLPESLLVQAAYRATDAVNTPGTGAQDAQLSQYTVEMTDCMQYGQSSGSDGKFSVTFEVKRENVGGAGVTRLRKPAAAVFFRQVDPTLPDIITKVDLTNTDRTAFEVVPTKAVGEVMVYIIDAATVSAWPNASEKSARGAVAQGTFRQQGSFAFVVKQCLEKLAAEAAGTADPADWANVNESALFDATGVSVSPEKKEAAKNAVKDAVAAFGNAISPEQMKAALEAAVK